MVTTEYLETWRDCAASVGDTETMLIAQIALGESPDLRGVVDWNCTPQVLRRLRRYTWRGARRIAARWGSPWRDR